MYKIVSLITSDCSKLFPPCWQEIHYMYGGIMIGLLIAIPIFEWLRKRWESRELIGGWILTLSIVTILSFKLIQIVS